MVVTSHDRPDSTSNDSLPIVYTDENANVTTSLHMLPLAARQSKSLQAIQSTPSRQQRSHRGVPSAQQISSLTIAGNTPSAS